MIKIFLITLIFLSTLNAQYTEKVKLPNIAFKMPIDENFGAMQRNCQWCHSFGYVTNQGKQSRKFWRDVVVKMRDVYKAPISDRDEKIATDYLFKHFGKPANTDKTE